ncbi:MAG: RNA pseudouridine synthase [Treponema sp.]|nr:RNA pseudouridine synthase [Treponema sp.]
MEHFTVLFEDSEILLIHKKYGVCVQGGAGVSHSLDEDLSRQCGYKIYLVHRLDKDTEGILVVAKNAQAAAKWTRLIGEKSVKKEYCAWCAGLPQINGRECKSGKLVSTLEQHGRTLKAELFYEVSEERTVQLEEKEVKVYLLNIVLGTGRLHQIRIQLAKAGAPLLADDQHGNFKLNKLLRKAGIKKLQLCAKRLTLPLGGKERTFEIELPPHFYR